MAVNPFSIFFACVAFLVTALPSTLFAQRSAREASGEIERLLQESKNSYDELDLDRAEDALARAVQIAEQFGIRNIALAEVLVQRGVVIFVRDKNREAARNYFSEALDVDDRVELDPLTTTPSLERIFNEARDQRRGRRSGGGFDAMRDPTGGGRYSGGMNGGGVGDGGRYSAPANERRRDDYRDQDSYGRRDGRSERGGNDYGTQDRRNENFRNDRFGDRDQFDRRGRNDRRQNENTDLVHRQELSAEADRALPLTVEVAPRINRQVYRVFVYFRDSSSPAIQRLEMQPTGQSGFEGQIPRRFMVGREINYYFQAENRRQDIVAQVGSARQPYKVPIRGDYSDPTGFASGSSLDGDFGGRSRRRDGARQFFGATVNLGTGFGYVKGDARPVNNPNADVSQPGIGPSSFHMLIELDLWLSDTFAFGPFARLQLGDFAHLEGGRVKFKVSDSGDHSFRIRGGGGYGRVAHLVQLKQGFDVTMEGPFLFTVGMTYRYRLNDMFSLVFSPDYLQLFGEYASYHLDLQAGVELEL